MNTPKQGYEKTNNTPKQGYENTNNTPKQGYEKTNNTPNIDEKTLKMINFNQFKKEDKKNSIRYIKEIPIGRVKAILKYPSNKKETFCESCEKIKAVGLMISPFSILVPKSFFHYKKYLESFSNEDDELDCDSEDVKIDDQMILKTMKFIPLYDQYRNYTFRIKLVSKNDKNEWAMVFLESGIGEFLFQQDTKQEYYFNLEESKPLKYLNFQGYFKSNSEKFVFQSKIFTTEQYYIKGEKIYFLSPEIISSGFFTDEDRHVIAVFNGIEIDEYAQSYDKNWINLMIDKNEEFPKKSKNIKLIKDNNLKYEGHLISKKDRENILKSINEYKSILVEKKIFKFDQYLYSILLQYINDNNRIMNLILGGKRTIDRILKIASVDNYLLDCDLVFKAIIINRDLNNEIKKLEFQESHIDTNILKNSLDSLYFSSEFKYLDLSTVILDEESSFYLCEFLIYNKSLKSLILCKTGLNNDLLEILSFGIKNSVSLELLNIGQNDLTYKKVDYNDDNESIMVNPNIMIIVDMLINLKQKNETKKFFQFISFENGFSEDDSKYFFNNIKGRVDFKFMNYSDTTISLEVSYMLKLFLTNNIVIKELVLNNCKISDEVFENIVMGLMNCENLCKLDLSRNVLTGESMKIFSEYMHSIKYSNLKESYLKIHGPYAKSKGSKQKILIKFLEEFTLILDHNKIQNEGIIDLIASFQKESPLLNLSLKNIGINKIKGSNILWEQWDILFTKGVPIKNLFLQSNHLDDDDALNMLKNINNCDSIQVINLCKNLISYEPVIENLKKIKPEKNFKIYLDKMSKTNVDKSKNLKQQTNDTASSKNIFNECGKNTLGFLYLNQKKNKKNKKNLKIFK